MTRQFLQFFLIVMMACSAAIAYADVKPQVRGQKIRDFVRLTFEWPETTLFTAKTDDNNVILTFDRKTNPNMGAVLKQLSPYIVKAEKKADGKTIVLTLNEPHRIRTFISDNVSGIDILDVNGGAKKIAKSETEEPVALEEEITETQEAEDAPKPQLAKKETKTKKPAIAEKKKNEKAKSQLAKTETKQSAETEFAELSPAAGEAEVPSTTAPAPAAPTVAAEPAPAPAAVAAPVATPPAETKQEPQSEMAAPAVPSPNVEVKKEAEATTAAPVPTGEIIAQVPVTEPVEEEGIPKSRSHDTGVSMVPMSVDETAEAPVEEAPVEQEAKPIVVEASEDDGKLEPLTSNKIVVSADDEGATMRFPLKERAAMAVFIRMNRMWVVFDKKIDFDLADFATIKSNIISHPVIVPNDKATILNMTVSDNIYPSIKQQEGMLDIAILLSPAKHLPDAALDISISTEPPAPAHVFVPAIEVGNTLEVTDPGIGDTLSITPIYAREQGMATMRNFVEFSLLPSTQGLVIAKKADTTEVTQLRNGLRVSLPNGASLSPQTVFEQSANIATPVTAAMETLFSDESWALEKGKSLNLTMNSLFNKTVFAADDGAKNLARLRMAQLYLSDGLMVEAIGMLDNIKRTNPPYYRSAKLSAMRGAANFLLYRFNDAARDFGSAELNNNLEVAYWRAMLSDLLGNPQEKYDFLSMNENYISKYPPIFRQRLAIVAADRIIASREYNAALKIFDTLSKDNIIAPVQSYVDFLTAKISLENGQEQEAMDVWKRLSADSNNKFVQARAKFAALMWELDNNKITRDQATDQLERLRLGWHGDGLELQVVQLLGDLYFEKQDYVNAMRVWQVGVTGFKNTGPAIEMSRKMEDVFVKLFNEGSADKMTPLEALALYYEYRAYTPAGAIGTQMIEKLSDRLVAVDLLSTAAQLLEQQMRTQMEKTERSRVGAKLADIYLMNNQPKRAMKSLQDSVYGDNPILLRIYRNQLTAKAMLLLDRPQEALTVLGQDESVGAEKLRTMIYWNEQNWPNITSSIENIFKKRPDPSAALTLEEGEYLLRLSLSYVFQNDAQQLQYMRDYFTPLLRDNPYKDAFEFVTAPDIRPSTRNFDDLLQSLSNTRGFITNYKARIQLADTETSPPAQP